VLLSKIINSVIVTHYTIQYLNKRKRFIKLYFKSDETCVQQIDDFSTHARYEAAAIINDPLLLLYSAMISKKHTVRDRIHCHAYHRKRQGDTDGELYIRFKNHRTIFN